MRGAQRKQEVRGRVDAALCREKGGREEEDDVSINVDICWKLFVTANGAESCGEMEGDRWVEWKGGYIGRCRRVM